MNIIFDDFLKEVNIEHLEFVTSMHEMIIEKGCTIKIELAKSGYVVSYALKKTKKVIANYVFRKKGMLIRIYTDFANNYIDFLETLPESIINTIDNAPVCKRLIDITTCNSKCVMGYDFTIKGVQYQKCRYNCFLIEINNENIPFIIGIVKNELQQRLDV